MSSFKDLIEEIKSFSENHKQINTFGFGDLSNISTKDINFNYLHIQPTKGTKNNGVQQQTFEIYIMDIMKGDNSNVLDGLNNLFFIGNDVINFFENIVDELDFEIAEQIEYSPFTGRFDDLTMGWVWTIKVNYLLNTCSIPLKDN